jgi:hypothetical protein
LLEPNARFRANLCGLASFKFVRDHDLSQEFLASAANPQAAFALQGFDGLVFSVSSSGLAPAVFPSTFTARARPALCRG